MASASKWSSCGPGSTRIGPSRRARSGRASLAAARRWPAPQRQPVAGGERAAAMPPSRGARHRWSGCPARAARRTPPARPGSRCRRGSADGQHVAGCSVTLRHGSIALGAAIARAQAAARSRRPGARRTGAPQRAASGPSTSTPAPPGPRPCRAGRWRRPAAPGRAAPASGTPMCALAGAARSWIDDAGTGVDEFERSRSWRGSARIEPGLALQRAGRGGALELVRSAAARSRPSAPRRRGAAAPGRRVRGVEQRHRRAPEQVPAAGASPGVDRAHARRPRPPNAAGTAVRGVGTARHAPARPAARPCTGKPGRKPSM